MKILFLVFLFFINTANAQGMYQLSNYEQHKEFSPKLDLSIGLVERSTRLPVDERLFTEQKPWLNFGKPKKFIPVPELKLRVDKNTNIKFRGRSLTIDIRTDLFY